MLYGAIGWQLALAGYNIVAGIYYYAGECRDNISMAEAEAEGSRICMSD